MEETLKNFSKAWNHAEIVGSFLLPEKIKEARELHDAGNISSEDLLNIENECVSALIEQQIAAGLMRVTDGEYHRRHWRYDFFWGLNGLKRVVIDDGHLFQPYETHTELTQLSARVSYNAAHPFFDHYAFAHKFADGRAVVKQTMPAPAELFTLLTAPDCDWASVYASRQDLIDDIAEAYRLTIMRFYELGCRYVQFDDCTWGRLCDPDFVDSMVVGGIDVNQVMAELLAVNNAALVGLPADLTVATHVCRGNHHSGWRPTGSYVTVAPMLLAKENVDEFLLEFDITLHNDFTPLTHLAPGKRVVLGLLPAHMPQVESSDDIVWSIKEAAEFVDLDRIGVSPRCGFHSEKRMPLTDVDQWHKIAVLQDVVRQVW